MENWKEIKGYEGIYKVSDLGNIKSLSRKVKFNHHVTGVRYERITKEKILVKRNCKGYSIIGLSKKGVTKQFRVCRLVAKHFIKNIEEKPCVNHINGDKKNDSVSNLEWCTYKENMKHAKENGLTNHLSGINHYGCKELVCTKTNKKFISIKEGAKYTGFDQSTLSRMLRGVYTNKTSLVYA